MKKINKTRVFLTGLTLAVFLLSMIIYTNPSIQLAEDSANAATNTISDRQMEVNKPEQIVSRIDPKINVIGGFNATGIIFDNNNPSYAGFLNPNSEQFVNQFILNESYAFWNMSLTAGYYFDATAYFTVNRSLNLGDLDADILFPNGSTWLTSQSKDDNEGFSSVLIPDTGIYILVIYPYTPDVVIPGTEPLNNTVNRIRFRMLDLPTLLDNDVDFDTAYYGSSVQTGTIPVGAPTVTYFYVARANTVFSVDFGFNDSGSASLNVTDSQSNNLLSVAENSTSSFLVNNPGSFTFTITGDIGLSYFLNVTRLHAENILDTSYEIHLGKFEFLWESETFNPNDYWNTYGSGDTSFWGSSTHVETYKIFIPATMQVSFNTTWKAGLLDITKYPNIQFDSLIRIYRYSDIARGNYGPYSTGWNYLDGSGTYIKSSKLTVYSSTDDWFLFQVGGSALSTGSHYGFTTNYTVYVTGNDQIDNSEFPGANHAVQNAVPSDYIGTNFTSPSLITSSSSNDYFNVTTYPNSRLIVDIEFDYSKGKLNLYLFNETGDLVGVSDSPNQNQQHIELLSFDSANYTVKVNTSDPYGNFYIIKILVVPIDDSFEPNDAITQPFPLPGSGNYSLFSAKGNNDFFLISLFKGDEVNVSIYFNGSLANLNMYVYDSNLNLQGSSVTTKDNESITFTASATDNYIILIAGIPSSYFQPGIDYQLVVNVKENDDIYEPNDASQTATPIQDGLFPDLKIRAGDEDWYRIYLKSGEQLDVSVDFNSGLGDIDIILYDVTTTSLLASSQTFNGHESFSYISTSDGDVLLRVVLFDGFSVSYSMNISIPEIDDSYGFEDNDNFSQAVRVNATTYPNIEARGGDWDYFVVSIPKDYAIIAEITFSASYDFELYLFSEQFAELAYSDTQINTERVGPVPIGENGSLYVVTHMKSYGITTYQLNITLGLSSVLLPPVPSPSGQFSTPSFGFPSSPLNLTVVTSITGIDFVSGVGLTTIGLGVGGAGAIGGQVLFNKKFKLKKKKP